MSWMTELESQNTAKRARLEAEAARIAGALARVAGVRKVLLFGSVARGEADWRSDLDLIRPGTRMPFPAVSQPRFSVSAMPGRRLQPPGGSSPPFSNSFRRDAQGSPTLRNRLAHAWEWQPSATEILVSLDEALPPIKDFLFRLRLRYTE